MQGRNVATSPQQQGSDIANGRARTTSIGSNDNHRAIDEACSALGHQFACNGYHHYHRGKIAQQNGHEKGDEAEYPQQFAVRPGLDGLRDDAETAMCIHYVNDGHGAQYEEEGGGYIAQTADELLFNEGESYVVDGHRAEFGEYLEKLVDVLGWIYQKEMLGIEQEDEPKEYGHTHGGGGLVDLDDIFKGNSHNTQDEYHGHEIIEKHIVGVC
jgi:hypothetical protein